MGSMFGDMDDGMNGFHSFGGMPGGMPGANPRRAAPSRTASTGPSASAEITKPLKVSLEELHDGTTKHLKIGRKLANGMSEDKVLEINVLPGKSMQVSSLYHLSSS